MPPVGTHGGDLASQRLAVGKRKGEDTREHASSSQPLSTLPGMYWESQGRAAAGTLGREQIAADAD